MAGTKLTWGQRIGPWMWKNGAKLAPWIQLLAFVVTTISLIVSIRSLNHSFEVSKKSADANTIHNWQRVVVYEIITEKVKANEGKKPVPFSDIKTAYNNAAGNERSFARQIGLSADHVSDPALKKILLELQKDMLINEVPPGDQYSTLQIPLDPRSIRRPIQSDMEFVMIHELTINPGKHTSNELSQIVLHATQARQDEYNYTLNQLLGNGLVTVTTDAKSPKRIVLWTRANCPTCPLYDASREAGLVLPPPPNPVLAPGEPEFSVIEKDGKKFLIVPIGPNPAPEKARAEPEPLRKEDFKQISEPKEKK
jgi:hypothetical protein